MVADPILVKAPAITANVGFGRQSGSAWFSLKMTLLTQLRHRNAFFAAMQNDKAI
jgi:hypothetical protein